MPTQFGMADFVSHIDVLDANGTARHNLGNRNGNRNVVVVVVVGINAVRIHLAAIGAIDVAAIGAIDVVVTATILVVVDLLQATPNVTLGCVPAFQYRGENISFFGQCQTHQQIFCAAVAVCHFQIYTAAIAIVRIVVVVGSCVVVAIVRVRLGAVAIDVATVAVANAIASKLAQNHGVDEKNATVPHGHHGEQKDQQDQNQFQTDSDVVFFLCEVSIAVDRIEIVVVVGIVSNILDEAAKGNSGGVEIHGYLFGVVIGDDENPSLPGEADTVGK